MKGWSGAARSEGPGGDGVGRGSQPLPPAGHHPGASRQQRPANGRAGNLPVKTSGHLLSPPAEALGEKPNRLAFGKTTVANGAAQPSLGDERIVREVVSGLWPTGEGIDPDYTAPAQTPGGQH